MTRIPIAAVVMLCVGCGSDADLERRVELLEQRLDGGEITARRLVIVDESGRERVLLGEPGIGDGPGLYAYDETGRKRLEAQVDSLGNCRFTILDGDGGELVSGLTFENPENRGSFTVRR